MYRNNNSFIFLFFLVCNLSHLGTVASWKITYLLNRKIAVALLTSSSVFVSSSNMVEAKPDCNSDCYSSCVRVVPGSESYCKTTCTEYCDQTDRRDGLSGSIDASRGETGILGGIDGTVTRGNDRPPSVTIIPKDMMKTLQLKAKPEENPRKGIYFKDFIN
jgi:hypothetical protein